MCKTLVRHDAKLGIGMLIIIDLSRC